MGQLLRHGDWIKDPPMNDVGTGSNANPSLAATGVVAVVDDDEHVASALGSWLELHGLATVCHATAEALLETLLPLPEGIAVATGAPASVRRPLLGAVLDLNLPGIDGVALAHQLRWLAPDLPLVLITALRDEDRLSYGALPSGVRCLRKPFSLDVLEDALASLLN